MSTEPVGESALLLDANGNPIETWGGKFERKFKENPFVPVRAYMLHSLVPPRSHRRVHANAFDMSWLLQLPV